jgi:RIO kinase 1
VRKPVRKFRPSVDHSVDPDVDIADDSDAYLDDAHSDYAMVTRARVRRDSGETAPQRRGRLTEAERDRLSLVREDGLSDADRPVAGDRWSTWERAEHGPTPRPDWVVTDLVAEDTELGVLKTGKEAEVHLLSREVPGTDRACLLAAKRYRGNDHRQFHRDAQYLEGRRMRRSRENRAIAGRTAFGRNLIAEQWAVAEFAALSRLWSAGLPVPYPVQRDGTEILLEFFGTPDGEAAPRLVDTRLAGTELESVWHHLVDALVALAAEGFTHGDLSAYNVLLHRGEPVLIDLPQVIDLAANPQGIGMLRRDVRNITDWFTSRGLAKETVDPEALTRVLLAEAGLTSD